ncbi:hypothetical protein NY10_156 [Carnobacterium antarcticum]|nr:hypothetical protein NY10_156 [Carnobacterium sp. CP1]
MAFVNSIKKNALFTKTRAANTDTKQNTLEPWSQISGFKINVQ